MGPVGPTGPPGMDGDPGSDVSDETLPSTIIVSDSVVRILHVVVKAIGNLLHSCSVSCVLCVGSSWCTRQSRT